MHNPDTKNCTIWTSLSFKKADTEGCSSYYAEPFLFAEGRNAQKLLHFCKHYNKMSFVYWAILLYSSGRLF